MNPLAPIGVFDSGIGGLTVVRELVSQMPLEGIVYLGDTARVPYGTRSPETVQRYAREGVRFLFSKGIKFLVVACNTVSSVGLEGLSREIPVPVLGVLQPGARAAVEMTRNGRVGVIGTSATIASSAYVRAIKAFNGGVDVLGQSCPLFVPLVEEGWLDGDVPELAAEKYLGGLRSSGIDTLVLGCTHYPLLKPLISKVMGADIELIDSAAETAREVSARLSSQGLENRKNEKPLREFYVTDCPEAFKALGERFLGTNIENISKVQLEVILDER